MVLRTSNLIPPVAESLASPSMGQSTLHTIPETAAAGARAHKVQAIQASQRGINPHITIFEIKVY